MKIENVQKLEGTRLQAPEGASSVNHQGFEYEVEEDGTVVVPTDAVELLAGHGFKLHVPAKKAPEPAKNGSGQQQGKK
jgi:hypothetical protein